MSASGVRVEIVSGEGRHEPTVDSRYIDIVAGADGAYAEKIAATGGSILPHEDKWKIHTSSYQKYVDIHFA